MENSPAIKLKKIKLIPFDPKVAAARAPYPAPDAWWCPIDVCVRGGGEGRGGAVGGVTHLVCPFRDVPTLCRAKAKTWSVERSRASAGGGGDGEVEFEGEII